MTELYEKMEQEAYEAASELITLAKLKPGNLLVVGCSTSEGGRRKDRQLF